MGLTGRSGADMTVALVGSPNVGKSTVFNALTGMRQHTGNWTGKTVSLAFGEVKIGEARVSLVDLPGCYSLDYLSPEEKVSRDFLMSGEADGVVIVCDALSLQRNLILAIQVLELFPRAVLCVNLMDEAKKVGAEPDVDVLSRELGIPVIPCAARSRVGIDELLREMPGLRENETVPRLFADYGEALSEGAKEIKDKCKISYFQALSILSGDMECDLSEEEEKTVEKVRESLELQGITPQIAEEEIRRQRTAEASRIADLAIAEKPKPRRLAKVADRILTGKCTAPPVMCAMLFVIFWITAWGADYPAQFLWYLTEKGEILLRGLFASFPPVFASALIDGVYRVSSWVLCVMLPPMAIFFPLFTLLEDLGVFPRIAFNLDRAYRACGSCGKHALTSAMGFGCNAVGVCGCRIIESPRERAIAVLTNSFIPCNGRIGGIFLIISVFFASSPLGRSAVFFAIFAFAVAMTFLVSLILSKTVYKGKSAPLALEMVPFRRPQILKTLVRSIFDRTLFVLGRALTVAAVSGLVIWFLTNVEILGKPILASFSDLLDPVGRLLGMDGVILCAFILGLPANEIVLPLCAMMYTSSSVLSLGYSSAQAFLGWNSVTALCVLIFTLFHWPCSTTLLTVRRECGTRMMIFAFLLPTAVGVILCFFVNLISRLIFI